LPARSYKLTAVDKIAPQQVVYSDPVFIDIEPAYATPLVGVQLQSLHFEVVGDQLPLRVIRTLSDGSTTDVSRSSTTSATLTVRK